MLDETVAALKEKLNIFEQEVEQQREQQKIKESNYEEEIQVGVQLDHDYISPDPGGSES